MIFEVKYTETYAGVDYGEYEFNAAPEGEIRLLASFGQKWIEDGEIFYGGLGLEGCW